MISQNFDFLRLKWPELADLGGYAESYTHTDPKSAVFNLRLFAENLVKDIYRDLKLPKPVRATFIDLLEDATFQSITPTVVRDKLHAIRMEGNKAAHGEGATTTTALWLLREAFDLGRWLIVNFQKVDAKTLPLFTKPEPSPHSAADSAKRTSKRVLDQLAAQEAQMAALLTELDTARQRVVATEREAADLKALAAQAKASADVLSFDEATTRSRIIDSMIASAGWNVSSGAASTSDVAKEYEVDGQPTQTGRGFVDYVLWDTDGSPLAVIEAKKTSDRKSVV